MKSNVYFIDTSAFIALYNSRDIYNEDAINIATRLNGCLFIVSDAVISETYSLLRYRVGFHTAKHFYNTILSNNDYTIVDTNNLLRKSMMEILEKFSDHNISYCDALSLAIMIHDRVNTVFAFDHHFEMMGVKRIYLRSI